MSTKLTLRLDEKLIHIAKEHSAKSGKSVSKMVADYFSLVEAKKEKQKSAHITPLVASLKGSLKKGKVSEADYKQYLEDKYV